MRAWGFGNLSTETTGGSRLERACRSSFDAMQSLTPQTFLPTSCERAQPHNLFYRTVLLALSVLSNRVAGLHCLHRLRVLKRVYADRAGSGFFDLIDRLVEYGQQLG
jgi:hypothetical protein